mmetsp:Transcript_44073/g.138503  ORF Transcript_44073/g.138503 Transcript_44073/m.138503 type:complete len:206 (-) Transcript_44073:3489-4106(-)
MSMTAAARCLPCHSSGCSCGPCSPSAPSSFGAALFDARDRRARFLCATTSHWPSLASWYCITTMSPFSVPTAMCSPPGLNATAIVLSPRRAVLRSRRESASHMRTVRSPPQDTKRRICGCAAICRQLELWPWSSRCDCMPGMLASAGMMARSGSCGAVGWLCTSKRHSALPAVPTMSTLPVASRLSARGGPTPTPEADAYATRRG